MLQLPRRLSSRVPPSLSLWCVGWSSSLILGSLTTASIATASTTPTPVTASIATASRTITPTPVTATLTTSPSPPSLLPPLAPALTHTIASNLGPKAPSNPNASNPDASNPDTSNLDTYHLAASRLGPNPASPLSQASLERLDSVTRETAVLRVGVNQVYPFVFLQGDRTFGFSVELWEHLAMEMGVGTEFVTFDSVASLLQGVQAGEVDLAIAGISVTANREASGLDFSYPIYHGGLQILTTLEALSPLDRFLTLFGGTATFIALGQVLGSSLLVGFLVWLFEHKHNEAFPANPIHGVGQGIWFAVVTLGTFGYGDVTPMRLPGRLIAACWMAMSFFIVGDFIGAMSANHRVSTTINGLEDLYGNEVAVVQGTTAEEYMTQKPVTLVPQANIEQSLEVMRQGKVRAIVLDYPTARYLTQLESDLVLAGKPLNQELYAIAVAEDQDVLLEGINLSLLRLHERDVWGDINRRWFDGGE